MDGYRGKSVVYRVKRKHKNVLNKDMHRIRNQEKSNPKQEKND
jgi:hypothetical protein